MSFSPDRRTERGNESKSKDAFVCFQCRNGKHWSGDPKWRASCYMTEQLANNLQINTLPLVRNRFFAKAPGMALTKINNLKSWTRFGCHTESHWQKIWLKTTVDCNLSQVSSLQRNSATAWKSNFISTHWTVILPFMIMVKTSLVRLWLLIFGNFRTKTILEQNFYSLLCHWKYWINTHWKWNYSRSVSAWQ